MDYTFLNALIISLYTIVLVPTAIRDRRTGRYLGILNVNILAYVVTLFAIESYILVNKFGFEFHALFRTIGSTALPFAGGYLYVVLTQKQLYGEEFRRGNKKGSS